MSNKQSGFTLIELLVVIGILGILLAIVLIAINPAAQFAQANNTSRTNDVNTILNAIHQYAADKRGIITALGIPVEDPATPLSEALEIKKIAGVDLCALLSPDYVSLLPNDPQNTGIAGASKGAAIADCTAEYTTRYLVVQDANGRITISAPDAEDVRGVTTTISVVR